MPKPNPTTDAEKQQATRMVEAYEGLGAAQAVREGPTVYSFLDSLESWDDTSPASLFASSTTISLWGGWDTLRSLFARLQAKRGESLIAAGRSNEGLAVSTLAARQSVFGATVGGAYEGLQEGVKNITDGGRLFGSESLTLKNVALVVGGVFVLWAAVSILSSLSGISKARALK